MDNESEVAYVRAVMENLPTLARRYLPQGRRQAPKRGRFQGHTIHSCMVSTPKETRCKAYVLTPRKMDTRNGGTRQRLSQTGVGDQAICFGGEDGSRSKGFAVMVKIR